MNTNDTPSDEVEFIDSIWSEEETASSIFFVTEDSTSFGEAPG